MADELKPCPLCGGEAHKEDSGSTTCTSCVDDEGWVPIALWQQRLSEDALRAEVARLTARLAKFEGPLTDEQAERLADDLGGEWSWWKNRDAAIRAAREGER